METFEELLAACGVSDGSLSAAEAEALDRGGYVALEDVVERAELLARWDEGWGTLRGALAGLTDADLDQEAVISGRPHSVAEALHLALAHVSYHVGQLVQLARGWRGETWEWLSVPPSGKRA